MNLQFVCTPFASRILMRYGSAVAFVLLFAAACQPTEEGPSQSSTMPPQEVGSTQTSTANAPIPPQTDNPAGSPTPALPTQEVHLIEYQIHMPQTLPAGRIAFNVENGGKEDHAFEIEGNGIEEKTQVLKRGNTAALEVDLKPGTYTVYCPVDGHKDKGMRTTVTVR
ncbi:MAG TPA: cupredoxin domain-containing protein [Thermoanaerobaculia bacterium]|nr:cupredoxin domain-containing protein [Thermoanaerobaculia bacterium]